MELNKRFNRFANILANIPSDAPKGLVELLAPLYKATQEVDALQTRSDPAMTAGELGFRIDEANERVRALAELSQPRILQELSTWMTVGMVVPDKAFVEEITHALKASQFVSSPKVGWHPPTEASPRFVVGSHQGGPKVA